MDYDSLDGEPVHLIFLIAAPNTEDNVHLEVLSRLSMLLMDDDFRANLQSAESVEEFLGYIDAAEKAKFPDEAEQEEKREEKPAEKTGYQILAVTACPTGIAHTYMAAESLENKAKEMAKILIDNGIKAIWNFAHIDLDAPEDVMVENVHLSESLMTLSYNLSEYRKEHEGM